MGHLPPSQSRASDSSLADTPPPLLRLVLTPGTNCLPSCDWLSRWVYTASPPAIGSHAGYVPPLLLRLVQVERIPWITDPSLAPAPPPPSKKTKSEPAASLKADFKDLPPKEVGLVT